MRIYPNKSISNLARKSPIPFKRDLTSYHHPHKNYHSHSQIQNHYDQPALTRSLYSFDSGYTKQKNRTEQRKLSEVDRYDIDSCINFGLNSFSVKPKVKPKPMIHVSTATSNPHQNMHKQVMKSINLKSKEKRDFTNKNLPQQAQRTFLANSKSSKNTQNTQNTQKLPEHREILLKKRSNTILHPKPEPNNLLRHRVSPPKINRPKYKPQRNEKIISSLDLNKNTKSQAKSVGYAVKSRRKLSSTLGQRSKVEESSRSGRDNRSDSDLKNSLKNNSNYDKQQMVLQRRMIYALNEVMGQFEKWKDNDMEFSQQI